MNALLVYVVLTLLAIELRHPARRRNGSQVGLVMFAGVTWFMGGAMAAMNVTVGLVTGGVAAAMTTFASGPRNDRTASTAR